MNLHELKRLIQEAGANKDGKILQGHPDGTESFAPEAAVAPDDRTDQILIKKQRGFTDGSSRRTRRLLCVSEDFDLYGENQADIGNNGSRKDGVGTSAERTLEAADRKPEAERLRDDTAGVTAMKTEGAGATAGADQLVDGKRKDHGIIRFL